jgi:GNAT superfamily N-acetyltransferase
MATMRARSVRLREFDLEPMSAAAADFLGPSLARIDPWARYAYAPSQLATFLAAEETGAPHFAIKVDGAVAGAVCVRTNWLRGPYLQLLALLPANQGHGIGGSILAWFEAEARAENAQNLWVCASEFNARAISFYERHGFSRTAALPDLVVDGTSEILLRKRLPLV